MQNEQRIELRNSEKPREDRNAQCLFLWSQENAFYAKTVKSNKKNRKASD